MSIVQKAVKQAGMSMVADTLPKESRGVKAFQRLIAAMRACEAEVLDRLSESEKDLNASLKETLRLQQENEVLKNELLQHRLKEGLSKVDVLTSKDRKGLLALAAPVPANGDDEE